MITPPTPYGILTRARQKKPLYFVQFGAVGDGSIIPALDEEFSTGRIKNASKDRKDWMLMPSGASQTVSVLGGRSTIGELQISIIDRGGYMTKFATTYEWKNRKVTLMAGYYDLPEEQYIPMFFGLVNNVEISSDGTTWIWTVTDLQRVTNAKTAFTGSTQLTQPMHGPTSYAVINNDQANADPGNPEAGVEAEFPTQSEAQGYIDEQSDPSKYQIRVVPESVMAFVRSIENFAPTSIQGTRGQVNLLRIDDEVMAYLSSDDGGDEGASFKLSTRGMFGTAIKNHDMNATVVNFVVLDGNPLDILLQLYTSINGDGTNGPYDVLPAGQGAKIDQDLVDVAGIEAQRDRFLDGYRMQFFIQEAMNIKTFIETEILKIINAFPLVKNDGRLSVKLTTVPLPTDVTAEFTDSNLAGLPSFQLNLQSQKNFFNRVDFQYDYDDIAGEFNTQTIVLNLESELKADEVSVIKMVSKGLRKGNIYQGDRVVTRYSNQVFKRFSKGCPTINADSFYTNHLVELGDFVTIRSAYLPDLVTRQRNGEPVICWVVDKVINWEVGQVHFILQATGFLSTRRYFVIAPNSYPDYLAATEEQRKYGFVSKRLGPKSGVMSNGDNGYYITP